MSDTNLNGPGPRNEAWRAFCGGLDPATIPAARRLALWNEFCAQQQNPPKSAASALREELTLRHGPDDSAWPALAKARLQDIEGTRKPAAATPSAAQHSALNALPAAQRTIALGAVNEAVDIRREIAQIRNSAPQGYRVVSARNTRLEQLEHRLERLRQLFPTVLAA